MAYGLPADGVNVLVPGDVDQEMQADIDAQWGNQGQQGQPQQQQPTPDPAALLQQMMAQMMQNMMNQMNHMFAQAASGATGQPPGGGPQSASPGADPRNWQGPANAGGWQHDRSLSNVRLDERAFRRIDKFTDKPSEWTGWKAQEIEAVRECDKTFADDLAVFEKREMPITNVDLSVCQQQLSATLSSRLIGVTGKEAFAIVRAAQGQGVEA